MSFKVSVALGFSQKGSWDSLCIEIRWQLDNFVGSKLGVRMHNVGGGVRKAFVKHYFA